MTGVHQPRDHFWGRADEAYNNAKDEFWVYRNTRSGQNRIKVIEKAIRKLIMHPGGALDKDIVKILPINQAKCLLTQYPNYKIDFKFDHVWDMLKDFEKFKDVDNDLLIGVKKTKMKRKIDGALKLKEFKEENKFFLSNLDSIDEPNIHEFILQEQKK
ncbi:uncharacterized protein [Nicotiana tomentosiformis]|uniref:uncharacterized protein n=1 Tax=Nicotiana tomentosiformis TaxID=4098 RepID=UPI00388C86A9